MPTERRSIGERDIVFTEEELAHVREMIRLGVPDESMSNEWHSIVLRLIKEKAAAEQRAEAAEQQSAAWKAVMAKAIARIKKLENIEYLAFNESKQLTKQIEEAVARVDQLREENQAYRELLSITGPGTPGSEFTASNM